jgi:predicted nuclease with TOPRIM domain
MQELKDVFDRIQEKKKERRELTKMFQDELKHNDDYQKILEDIKTLREKKKSIENQAKANALADSTQLDNLTEEIKGSIELLSDVALTKLMNRETVEILDEANDIRYAPVFTVRFKKEEGETYQQKAEAVRAESHKEVRTFAPA